MFQFNKLYEALEVCALDESIEVSRQNRIRQAQNFSNVGEYLKKNPNSTNMVDVSRIYPNLENGSDDDVIPIEDINDTPINGGVVAPIYVPEPYQEEDPTAHPKQVTSPLYIVFFDEKLKADEKMNKTLQLFKSKYRTNVEVAVADLYNDLTVRLIDKTQARRLSEQLGVVRDDISKLINATYFIVYKDEYDQYFTIDGNHRLKAVEYYNRNCKNEQDKITHLMADYVILTPLTDHQKLIISSIAEDKAKMFKLGFTYRDILINCYRIFTKQPDLIQVSEYDTTDIKFTEMQLTRAYGGKDHRSRLGQILKIENPEKNIPREIYKIAMIKELDFMVMVNGLAKVCRDNKILNAVCNAYKRRPKHVLKLFENENNFVDKQVFLEAFEKIPKGVDYDVWLYTHRCVNEGMPMSYHLRQIMGDAEYALLGKNERLEKIDKFLSNDHKIINESNLGNDSRHGTYKKKLDYLKKKYKQWLIMLEEEQNHMSDGDDDDVVLIEDEEKRRKNKIIKLIEMKNVKVDELKTYFLQPLAARNKHAEAALVLAVLKRFSRNFNSLSDKDIVNHVKSFEDEAGFFDFNTLDDNDDEPERMDCTN